MIESSYLIYVENQLSVFLNKDKNKKSLNSNNPAMKNNTFKKTPDIEHTNTDSPTVSLGIVQGLSFRVSEGA